MRCLGQRPGHHLRWRARRTPRAPGTTTPSARSARHAPVLRSAGRGRRAPAPCPGRSGRSRAPPQLQRAPVMRSWATKLSCQSSPRAGMSRWIHVSRVLCGSRLATTRTTSSRSYSSRRFEKTRTLSSSAVWKRRLRNQRSAGCLRRTFRGSPARRRASPPRAREPRACPASSRGRLLDLRACERSLTTLGVGRRLGRRRAGGRAVHGRYGGQGLSGVHRYVWRVGAEHVGGLSDPVDAWRAVGK